jgi:hypothetical protein
MRELPDLAADPRALRVVKRALPAIVSFATEDGICETVEGPVRYRAGDAILTGVRGERWPVERERFLASYAPEPPTRAGEDGRYVKHPATALALRLNAPVAVPVGWQADPLLGQPGDWLLRYADGSYGVARDEIFRESYGPGAGETRWPLA